MIEGYSHISFDLDGTLVGTRAEYRHQIIPPIIKELGGSCDDPESIDRFWFEIGRSKIIKEEFRIDPEKFWQRFREVDPPVRRAEFTTAYPDVKNALGRLKILGKKISVITGSPASIAKAELEKLGSIEFDHICSIHDEGFREKPAPDGMHDTLKKLGEQASETLYIGNGMEDALFAEAAGCGFIFLNRNEYTFPNSQKLTSIETLHQLFL
ncbi:MAG TPA: HAD family hydrolase [Patescibacteria group bacterium]|nr:HAD family hydrolase [Patescibacteria group bacterium]